MMLTISLCVGAICALIFVFWMANGWQKTSSRVHQHLREVDLAAFRNLLSRDDEAFLKRTLTARHYLQVRRARLRATQEYLGWIAGNCAVLLSLLRSIDDHSNADQSADIPALAQTALRLRLIAVGFWLLLWVEYVLPDLEIRPLHTIKKYEDLWRNARVRLDVKTAEAPVIAG
jgi:hypothetical protein